METLKLQGANWKNNNIPEKNDYYYCTNVYEKINPFGQAHRACQKIFDLRCTKIKVEQGEKEILEQ